MSQDQHILWAAWDGRIQPLGEIAAHLRRFLALLRDLHPDFGHWQLLGSKCYETLAPDYADLEPLLIGAARPRKSERERYSALDDKFNLTPASESGRGFSFSFYTSSAGTASGMKHGRPDYVEVNIDAGGSYNNSIQIIFPAGRADLLGHDLVRQMLLATIDCWHAACAQVFSPAFVAALQAGRQQEFGMLRAPWFAYLRHPLLAASLRPEVPCRLDRLGSDGLLFTLTPQAPDPARAEDVQRARQLQALFDFVRCDHRVTLFGWPGDPDEARYTAQVTGAPPGRAYVVAFAAFDGYDAERKVLLYARLFRVDPGWGADLHPAYRDDPARLEALPFVVQARQHLAAVEYAGANTPIEWHVGIRDTAAALATLLNEWAAIPRQRLRVVYTPCEPQPPAPAG